MPSYNETYKEFLLGELVEYEHWMVVGAVYSQIKEQVIIMSEPINYKEKFYSYIIYRVYIIEKEEFIVANSRFLRRI